MSSLVYPSDLVCDALNIPRDLIGTVKAEADGYCALCGKPHKIGDTVDLMDMGKSFTLNMKLASPDSPYRCLSCAKIVESQDFLKSFGCGVTTRTGMYKCLKKVEMGYWLLNPPEPPFIINVQVSRSQHMIWRSVVNYSREVIFLRLGENVLKLRVRKLKEAKEATEKLINALEKAVKSKAIKHKVTRTVISFSDLKGERMGQSELYDWVDKIVELEPAMQAHVDNITSLTTSESFSLDFVLKIQDEQPELIQSKNIQQ